MAATQIVSDIAGREREFLGAGVTPAMHTVNIATTSIDDIADAVALFQFPDEACYLSRFGVNLSDMDTGTALVVDFGISDGDGTIDTVLINDTAAGQTGANDESDAGVLAVPIDVSGKYLEMVVVAAATTAVAGTVQFYVEYLCGLNPLTSD